MRRNLYKVTHHQNLHVGVNKITVSRRQSLHGFTLIELLVVIAIIALLLSITLPALSRAKVFANRIICSSRISQQCLGVMVYSNENETYVPAPLGAGWFWDISFWTTNEISRYAGFDDHEIFTCPSNRLRKPGDARWWQYSWAKSLGPSSNPVSLRDETILTVDQQKSYYRVLPMLYLFDRYDKNLKSTLPKTLMDGQQAEWIRKLSAVKSTGSKIMIMDVVISDRNDWNFFDIRSGGMPGATMGTLWDTTNHNARRMIRSGNNQGPEPEGANIGFADGHVEWKQFKDMSLRLDYGRWYWW